MTTNYHTPFSGVDVMSAINFNTRLSDLDSAISDVVDNGGASTTLSVTLGEGVGAYQAGYIDLSDGQGYLLDANAATPRAGTIRGIWTATALSGATGTLQINGIITGYVGLTARQPVYVSSSAGNITNTRPSPTAGGAQVAIMQMGYAIDNGSIFIRPLPIQYHKRDAIADDGTLTVNHHGDDRGYTRNLWAYITETVAGSLITEYADSNRDTGVGLRDRTVSTYTIDLCTNTANASASDATSGAAGNAFDDSTATRWSTTAAFPQWVEYDFGTDKTIRRFTLQAFSTTTQTPKDFDLEYFNGSTWETALSVTGETGWTSNEKRTFDVDGSFTAGRWRVNVSDVDGSTAISVAEIEMMEASTYTDGADQLAQTFTLASSTDIQTLELNLRKIGTPSGTITVRIETVSGSNPTGTLADAAASLTFGESSVSSSYADKSASFASSFTLAAGTYAIVLSTDRLASESNYILWGADGSSPGYTGEMRSELSSTWSAENKDAVFGLYEPGVSHPSHVQVDWWSSTHADMVNRYGDGSGADLDTKTTFKCLRDAGFDDVTVVVEID